MQLQVFSQQTCVAASSVSQGGSPALAKDLPGLCFFRQVIPELGFPSFQVESKAPQGGFQGVLVSLFGSTLCSLAIFKLTKEDLFWQSHTGHSHQMASPSELCLCQQDGDTENVGLAKDFSVRNSVLPLTSQKFPQTAQVEMV